MGGTSQKSLAIIMLSGLSLMGGCASGPSFEAGSVVERMGDADETPEWTHGGTPLELNGGDIIFIATTSMSGNARPDACLKAGELSARAEFLKYLKSNISATGQLQEVAVTEDPSYESLTTFLSQGSIRGAKTSARYWERREESNQTGQRVLKLNCAVKVSISASELQRQMREAVGENGNAAVRKKLEDATTSMIESLSKQKPAH